MTPHRWLLIPAILLVLGQALLARGWVEWRPDCDQPGETHHHLNEVAAHIHSHCHEATFGQNANAHSPCDGQPVQPVEVPESPDPDDHPCDHHVEGLLIALLGNPQLIELDTPEPVKPASFTLTGGERGSIPAPPDRGGTAPPPGPTVLRL